MKNNRILVIGMALLFIGVIGLNGLSPRAGMSMGGMMGGGGMMDGDGMMGDGGMKEMMKDMMGAQLPPTPTNFLKRHQMVLNCLAIFALNVTSCLVPACAQRKNGRV